MSDTPDSSAEEKLAPGLAAFDSLRAENEPWLEQCFVPPPEFDLIAGRRSVVVFGERGSGKTALYQALRRRLMPTDARPNQLGFEWCPQAGADPEAQMEAVSSATAEALLSFLARWPSAWDDAPGHVRKTLTGFVHKYLADSLPDFVTQLAQKPDQPGELLVRSIALTTPEGGYLESASAVSNISQLTQALSDINLQGVYVLVDPDKLTVSESLGRSLFDFMSTMRFFENPQFRYKLVFPTELMNFVRRAGGIVRRRLDRYKLNWLGHDLQAVVEKRFWLASGGEVENLADVCQDETLPDWLARCGGASPRGWLDQARPLAAHYLNLSRPLGVEEWHHVRRLRPPEFWLDKEQRRVTIGYREIDDLPDVEWAILSYLYHHQDRICSRDELYHRAHKPASEAAPTDSRVFAKEYEGALNNALLRLRQAIEPDPSNPLFIVTHKGKGVKLEHVW